MLTLPIKPSPSFWVVNEQTTDAKDIQILLITGLAGVSIFALTVSLMAHLGFLVGINAITQHAYLGIGIGTGLTAISVAIGCNPSIEPSIPIDNAEALKTYLSNLTNELIQNDGDPLQVIQKCAQYIPLEMLQEASQVQDALKMASRMLHEANFYHAARRSLTPNTHARLEKVQDALISTVDAVLMGFGIADFFKPSDSQIVADFKFQKIMMLMSLFTLLTTTLLPLLGVTAGASIVGGIMLLIAILSVIWPHIRPSISSLPSSVNWSEKIQSGALLPTTGRRRVTSEMYQALKAKSHVLLTGPSGIGKTQTAQAFTQRLVQGEFPEFAGKKVFYFNAAELVSSSDLFSQQNTVLKRIEEAIGAHKEDFILIIDEVHVAFERHENNPFGDLFKTFLDKMSYVIGLTTDEEYREHILTIRGFAGARRFDKQIAIENTQPGETEAILNHFLAREAPHVLVAPGALQKLIQETEGKPQPLSALSILAKCVTNVTQTDSTATYVAAEKKRVELEHLASQGVIWGGEAIKDEEERYKMIDALEGELKDLEEVCAEELGKMDHLTRTRKQLSEVREEKWKLVEKINTQGATKRDLNQLMLLKHYLEPALENRISEIGSELNVPVVIDQNLVQKVMDVERENFVNRQKILEKAKVKK